MRPADVKKFQKAIEGPLHEMLKGLYPGYVAQYDNFRQKTGPQCPFCKAAARHMFKAEHQRRGQDFITRFNNDNWNGYA